MAIVSGHKTDVGRVRQQNEDYIWVDEAVGLYIVADGMGGHEAGDVASALAANTVGPMLAEKFRAGLDSFALVTVKEALTKAIETANITVRDAAKEAGQKRRMGSTIIVALVQADRAYISHAGDTRAYLIRAGSITQLTRDDSWSAQFGATGPRSKADHILTKAIGQDSPVEPSFTEVELQADDWLLLCSDGLWNLVTDADILATLQAVGDTPPPVVDALVDAANEAGGKDNISVIAIKAVD